MSDYLLGLLFIAIIAAVIGGLAALIYHAGKHDHEQQTQFMSECLKDHKEYECTAMWRTGEPEVLPMPIIIPMR